MITHSRTGAVPNSGDNGDSFLGGCRHVSQMGMGVRELPSCRLVYILNEGAQSQGLAINAE